MAATKTSARSSANGSGPSRAAAKAKQAGGAVGSAAQKARGPGLAAGAGLAGLAGGLALGSRLASRRRGIRSLLAPRPRLLGMPLGPRSGAQLTAKAIGRAAKQLSSATDQVSDTAGEVRQVREQLEKANRQSPIEVLLDGLTHRRGAHRREGG